MNDRELIVLAAKAAGVTLEQEWPNDRFTWRPLTDDGQAFRLAVKLDMSIGIDSGCVDVNGWCTVYFVDHAGDKAAATRLAIVRAAAEMGKS